MLPYILQHACDLDPFAVLMGHHFLWSMSKDLDYLFLKLYSFVVANKFRRYKSKLTDMDVFLIPLLPDIGDA
eukprot:c43241_g1_i1 orf=62-277(-)